MIAHAPPLVAVMPQAEEVPTGMRLIAAQAENRPVERVYRAVGRYVPSGSLSETIERDICAAGGGRAGPLPAWRIDSLTCCQLTDPGGRESRIDSARHAGRCRVQDLWASSQMPEGGD